MTNITLRWIPPFGETIVYSTEPDAPFFLRDASGLMGTLSQPETVSGPGQHGVTVIDNRVEPRIIPITVDVAGRNHQEFWERRQMLSSANVVLPIEFGESPHFGVLQILRPHMPHLELEAVSQMGPDESYMSELYVTCELEYFGAYPFWREVADRTALLEEQSGGMSFPLTHPFTIPSGTSVVEIENSGTVPAPVRMRIFGELDTFRMINLTTNKVLEVEGLIAEGDYIEVFTEFAKKSIILHRSNGTSENAIHRLNLSRADFWRLERGLNVVRFEASSNTSGSARLFWRQRYSGI